MNAQTLHPAAQHSLDAWHAMVTKSDLGELDTLLDLAAVFHSPMAFKPYEGAPVVAHILRTVLKVFSGFSYEREFVSADGNSVVLEFRANVGTREVKGIDMIRFDDQGKIVDFEVMIRPMSGLQALGEEMGRRLAQK